MKAKSLAIYELNTAAFLSDASHRFKKNITLGSVPAELWDEVAGHGLTTVWFMGIWTRSPIARAMAIKEPYLRSAFPAFKDSDVLGSAYSIKEYNVDSLFGGNEGLRIARSELKKRGIQVMLDYVPNHVAIDHDWATYHPEYLVAGTPEELEKRPSDFIQTPSAIIARAKDPNFPPWSDVLQLNAFSLPARKAFADTLTHIASMCDAVRCDMAMLMSNDIFARTWGKRVGEAPKTEFWPGIIRAVKKQYPDFVFLAEVYWKKERDLLAQGFDFCYDKEFYDDLVEANSRSIVKRISQPVSYQSRLLRFIENHDEPRAATTFTAEQHKAAAVITALGPTATLFHEGEFEGWKVKIPVQLKRRPVEKTNVDTNNFYSDLLNITSAIKGQKYKFKVLNIRTNFLFRRSSQIIGWQITVPGSTHKIFVNYSDQSAKGILDQKLHSSNEIVLGSGNVGELSQNQLTDSSIELHPWQYVVLRSI